MSQEIEPSIKFMRMEDYKALQAELLFMRRFLVLVMKMHCQQNNVLGVAFSEEMIASVPEWTTIIQPVAPQLEDGTKMRGFEFIPAPNNKIITTQE